MFIAKLLCWKHSQLLIWDGYLRVRIMRFLSCVCRGSLSTPLSFGKSWKLASLHGTHNTFNCFNGLETKRLVVKTHIHCYVYSQRALRAKLNKIKDYIEKEERLLRKIRQQFGNHEKIWSKVTKVETDSKKRTRLPQLLLTREGSFEKNSLQTFVS